MQVTPFIQMGPVPSPNSALMKGIAVPLYPSCLHTTWVHAQKSMHMCCTVPPNQSYAIPLIVHSISTSYFAFYSSPLFHSFSISTFPLSISLSSVSHALSPFLSPYPPSPLTYSGIIDVPVVTTHCTPHSIVLHFHTTTARGGASHQT